MSKSLTALEAEATALRAAANEAEARFYASIAALDAYMADLAAQTF